MIPGTPIADAPFSDMPAVSAIRKTTFQPPSWFLALALVIITCIAYLPTLRAGFVWDDDSHLTANATLVARHGLQMIWSSPAVARYFPLTLTTYWVERQLWGLHPAPYHVVNILFHAASAVLVFFLLRRLRIPGAWLVAAVWAVHPVNVQSVAWISELKSAQSGLFFLATLLFFLIFAEWKQRQHFRWYTNYIAGLWYVLALLCAAAAMLSNAATAVLALVLFLPVWWQRGYAEPADAVRIAPFFTMSWLVAGLAILQQRSQILATGPADWWLRPPERLVVGGRTIWFYVAKLLWPARLAFVYSRWDIRPLHWWSWLPLAALVALALALWRWRRQPWSRAALFGGSFFVLTLLPVLGLVNIPLFHYAFVADRFQYLASLGFITLVCAGAAALWRRAVASSKGSLRRAVAFGEGGGRCIGAVAALVLLGALGTQTWRQTRIYHDQEILWRDTVAKSPQCWMARYNLGNILLQMGKLNAARAQYEQALRANPDCVEARNNLGSVLLNLGKIDAALEQYQLATRASPASPSLHCNLGIVLERVGRIEDAIDQYQQALQLDPDYAQAHNNLANIFVKEGRFTDAVAHYRLALESATDSAQLHWNLGNVFAMAGNIDEALAQYQQALRIKPDYADAHSNLGDLLLSQGQISDAIQHFQQALRVKPDSVDARYGLATALERSGKIEEAYAQYEQAQWLDSDPHPPIRLQPSDQGL